MACRCLQALTVLSMENFLLFWAAGAASGFIVEEPKEAGKANYFAKRRHFFVLCPNFYRVLGLGFIV